MFFLPERQSGGLWAVLGGCVGSAWWLVGCSWWVGRIVLDGCLGYDWRLYELLLAGREDCIGWLFGLCLSAVRTASEGRLYCFLWLPGLYSVVAQAAFCGCSGCIIPAVAVCFWNMRESPCRIVCCDRGSPLLCFRPRLLRSCRQSSVVAEFCQFTKCPLALRDYRKLPSNTTPGNPCRTPCGPSRVPT